MTTTDKTYDLLDPSISDNPGDIPTVRPPALTRLDALLGEWEMEAVFEADYFAPGSPPVTAHGGRTTFDWLGETSSLSSVSPSTTRPHPAALPSSKWRLTARRSRSTTSTPVESPATTTWASRMASGDYGGMRRILATLRRGVLVRRHRHHWCVGGFV